VRILFVGDVFGRPGRQALLRRLPGLMDEQQLDCVIVNGENAANGAGITSKIARELLSGGVDVITTGNHVWRQREVYDFLSREERIVRPGNYPAGAPGRPLTVVETRSGQRVAVVNLSGGLFMDTSIGPFRIVDQLVDDARSRAEHVIVDLHAEATSEKVAMGHYLDGRVTAVIGTHTHVQTADEHVSTEGTAYITDVGMTGPRDSVIGVRTDIILRRFLTEMPQQFVVAEGPVRMDYVIIHTKVTGLATSIERHEETLEAGEGVNEPG